MSLSLDNFLSRKMEILPANNIDLKNLKKNSDPLLSVLPAIGYLLEIKDQKKKLLKRIIDGSLEPFLYTKSRNFDTILYEAEREITINLFKNLLDVTIYDNVKDFCIDCSKFGPKIQTMFINFPQDPKDTKNIFLQILITHHMQNEKPSRLITELSPSSL